LIDQRVPQVVRQAPYFLSLNAAFFDRVGKVCNVL